MSAIGFERSFLLLRKKVKTIRSVPYSYVHIEGGLTRTIWLLSNGATSFPVVCETSAAERLFELAGQERSDFRSVKELLG